METLTLTGCGDTATVTVQLWDVDSNESLAAVNVTVLPLPKITGTLMRVGYRYLDGRTSAAHVGIPGTAWCNRVAQQEHGYDHPLHEIRGRSPATGDPR